MASVSRYMGRRKVSNAHEMYREHLEIRGRTHIRHFTTPMLRYPTDLEKQNNITAVGHIWKTGDRYYKLANTQYGDPRYWWVIAWYNKKPTEAHVNLGDSIYIPTPLHSVLELFGL